MTENNRDDLATIQKINLTTRLLIGIAFFCPISFIKKTIFRLLGASIGKDVYIGPGAVIISSDYSQVTIGNKVFISPDIVIKVDNLIIGDSAHIGYQTLLVGNVLSIGNRCNISNRTFIESEYAPVNIENDVTIAASVIISSHDGAYKQTRGMDLKIGSIRIKEHAFIGNHSTILPGVTIGKKAIVGAGAVVTKDVADDSVVVGIPAREIKNIK